MLVCGLLGVIKICKLTIEKTIFPLKKKKSNRNIKNNKYILKEFKGISNFCWVFFNFYREQDKGMDSLYSRVPLK